MSVDATTVRRIAHLARIAVTDDEVPHLQGELDAILAFVEQLSEVDVKGVEPMTSVTPVQMKKRADVVTGSAAQIVANAPATEDRFFSYRKWSSRTLVMCMLCDDEVAYKAHMDFSTPCRRRGGMLSPVWCNLSRLGRPHAGPLPNGEPH
jgi:aspartyl-tRNA(Asn)/glutamyl-tRNA(Gln) amidotransferase subunit C